MDIPKIIADLVAERSRLEEAIVTLEKLSPAWTPRRGRPPATSGVTSPAPQRVDGHNGSSNGLHKS